MAFLEPKKIALVIAVLAGFLTPFDLSAVNIALPSIGSEFSMDAVSLGWVAGPSSLTGLSRVSSSGIPSTASFLP